MSIYSLVSFYKTSLFKFCYLAELFQLLSDFQHFAAHIIYIKFSSLKRETKGKYTDKAMLNDHIKDIFWLFMQAVSYCCMKIVQKARTFCATFIQQNAATCL